MPEHLRPSILRGVVSPAVQYPAESLKNERSRTAPDFRFPDLRHYLASLAWLERHASGVQDRHGSTHAGLS